MICNFNEASLSFSSVLSLGSFTEEKLRKRIVALVLFRRLIAHGWTPSGVASSLDGRLAFGSGVCAFFSGVGLPAQVFSGYGLIPPDLSLRCCIYLGERPAFASGALTFFSGVGRSAFVSVSRSSLVVMAAFYRVFPIMV
ncbi:hypothetical protein F2Q68_00002308 [Brassica cretica]|uniref:Uncharacterized protein n=1 Tax=Brassica cretica TaxID=69181 RepID=A0A8S9JCQ8_BRACR|nr:hypothetical protein F2Q68_00002308 [Brassica cretica]